MSCDSTNDGHAKERVLETNGKPRFASMTICRSISILSISPSPSLSNLQPLKELEIMSRDTNSSEAETCPVDAATRAAWLKSNSQGKTPFSPPNPPESPLTSASCDSSTIDQRLPQSTHPSNSEPASSTTYFSRFKSLLWASPSPLPSQSTKSDSSLLSTARVISSIPRTETKIAGNEGQAANNEIESGTSSTGKWIYPSEKMFFEAMKRKGYSSDERDMKTIVPIHNAVNERAWKEIRLWEVPFCDE